jgi:8-oxo-dGTP diphosphatase
MPYRIACLCDLRDDRGRILLLTRKKAPNLGLVSPIGGKLDVANGESPAQCAQREIMEEVGLQLPLERLHLLGMVAETAARRRRLSCVPARPGRCWNSLRRQPLSRVT